MRLVESREIEQQAFHRPRASKESLVYEIQRSKNVGEKVMPARIPGRRNVLSGIVEQSLNPEL
jgi:hypothetical protein